MDIKQKPDGSVVIYSDIEGKDCLRSGGTKTPTPGGGQGTGSAKYRTLITACVSLAAVSGNGGVAAWAPDDTSIDYIVTKVDFDITTAGSGTVSIGTAANATTSSSNVISAGSLAAAATLSGAAAQHLAASQGQYVTATASGTPTGLAGYMYIHYYPVG